MKKNFKNFFNIENNIIVITGGAGYLGSEFSSALSDAGAIPVILDKNKIALEILKKKFSKKKQRGYFFEIDLNSEDKVKATINLVIRKYKKIDCLINAAGFTGDGMLKTNSKFFGKFESYDFKLWEKSLTENLSSTFIATKIVSKYMLKRKKGSIVNFASDYGVVAPDHRIYKPNKKINYKGVKFNTPLSYSVAKSGIISMTKHLATYWAKKGIRVNCISPTGVYKKNHSKQFVKQLSERIPLGRMANREEINGAIIYLCSNASSFVTGHNLIVDGGRTIW